ncbi:MAG: GNAT family N-acetyltransferase [Hyphomicrobiaceae bacterium]|nr:GNAT family N-acetyltransferase [Hyphomicrobiaceae bacterium]
MPPQETQSGIVVRKHTPDDFDRLARMNRELIEDEGHRSPLTVEELKERFERFVTKEGWSVDLLLSGDEIIGFATHRYEDNDTGEGGRCVHLRQFFIARDRRGGGIGRAALEELIHTRFRPGERIFLDVLETNPGGKTFWSRTGFTPYGTIMEMNVPKDGDS